MAYRMKMFKSQKPSSVDLRDLRVSDFKRVPGFNYVLSVSRRRTTTRTTRCALRSERAKEKIVRAIDAEPRARQRAKRNSSGEQFGVASLAPRAITPWIRDGSLIAAHNMLWVLWVLWGPMPREP